MSITTKRGDGGMTDLIGGVRVSKADPRIACCGDADELCAVLGLARSLTHRPDLRQSIETIQRDLFVLGSELAGGDPARGLTAAHVAALDALVDATGAGEWTGFVLPGADPPSAALHLARTVCRRLERGLAACREAGMPVGDVVMSYVNRLSDALFVLARQAEGDLTQPDILKEEVE